MPGYGYSFIGILCVGGRLMKTISFVLFYVLFMGTFASSFSVAYQQKSKKISRLINKYNQCKAAMCVFRQEGWRNCTPVQRRRIFVAGMAVGLLVVGIVGGIWFSIWKVWQRQDKNKCGQRKKEVFNQGTMVSDEDLMQRFMDGYRAGDYSIELLGQMIDMNKISVVAKNRHDRTLLHFAADHGLEEVVGFLVVRMENVDVKDYLGVTPLNLAVQRNHQGVARLLIEKGAQVSGYDLYGAKNKTYKTFLKKVMQKQKTETV